MLADEDDDDEEVAIGQFRLHRIKNLSRRMRGDQLDVLIYLPLRSKAAERSRALSEYLYRLYLFFVLSSFDFFVFDPSPANRRGKNTDHRLTNESKSRLVVEITASGEYCCRRIHRLWTFMSAFRLRESHEKRSIRKWTTYWIDSTFYEFGFAPFAKVWNSRNVAIINLFEVSHSRNRLLRCVKKENQLI